MEGGNILTCPYCESGNVRENKYVAAVGPSTTAEYPAEEKYIMYRCLACGREFDEREMEEDQA